MFNRVHLQIVFVLLYSVCRFVGVLSCMYVIRLSEREREKEQARGNNNDLSYVPSKRKEEIHSGTSGCGSFVVPYFQPVTSTDRLHRSRPIYTQIRSWNYFLVVLAFCFVLFCLQGCLQIYHYPCNPGSCLPKRRVEPSTLRSQVECLHHLATPTHESWQVG